MSSAHASSGSRLVYIDWFRFIVVSSLAPFHAAISFTGLGSVYVYDTPVRDILLAGGRPSGLGPPALGYFTVFLDTRFMHLLFLLSGIGAVMSLRKRTGAEFMRARCTRLLVPLLVCVPPVISVQSRLGAVSFGTFSGSFFAWFPGYFVGLFTGLFLRFSYDWVHLWFLGYLFVFSAMSLPLFLGILRKGESSRILSGVRRFTAMPMLLIPALWTGLLEAVFRPGWPGSLNLVNDWAVFSLNLSFFIAGFIVGMVPELPKAVER